MAVNKNFVVKNGIEVATDLIFASSDLDKVGIGSTIPTKLLEVGGDFKATGNATIVGVATASSFVGNLTGNASGTSGGLSGTPDILVRNITGAAATFTGTIDADIGIRVGAGESIGSDGAAVVYYGDGSNLSDIVATSGGSLGFSTAGAIGYGVTFLKFVGAGVSTLSAPHSGIATLTIVGGGGGGSASIGIGTTQGAAGFDTPIVGNLWYHTELGRLFIYYNDGSSAQWVDAAPFNIGIITASIGSLSQGTASGPPLAFSGDTSTGLFSPATGKQTFVSVGASILNVNPDGIDITGVSTLTGDISLTGDILVSGGGTIGPVSGVVTYYGDGQYLTNIQSGVGIQTAGAVGYGVTLLNFVGTGVSSFSTPTAGVSTIIIEGGGGSGTGLSTVGINTGFIFSNPNSINDDQDLTNSDHNYAMFGPITLNATVTVGAGNTFTIV